ncbi:hypothetical protein LguiA_013938 [Lonicera macranthoides]
MFHPQQDELPTDNDFPNEDYPTDKEESFDQEKDNGRLVDRKALLHPRHCSFPPFSSSPEDSSSSKGSSSTEIFFPRRVYPRSDMNSGPCIENSKLGAVLVADSKAEPTVLLVDSKKAKLISRSLSLVYSATTHKHSILFNLVWSLHSGATQFTQETKEIIHQLVSSYNQEASDDTDENELASDDDSDNEEPNESDIEDSDEIEEDDDSNDSDHGIEWEKKVSLAFPGPYLTFSATIAVTWTAAVSFSA